MVGEFAREDLPVAHQYNFYPEVAGGQDGAFNGRLWGEITPHRVERDFHGAYPVRLFLYLGELASAIGAAVAADAMRHHRLAARRAGTGVDGTECVVGTAHVLFRMRGSAFGCLHGELLPKCWLELIRSAAV